MASSRLLTPRTFRDIHRNSRDDRARHLVSSGNDAGGVAVFGGGGLLTSDKRMSWNTQTGTLTVPRLQASEVTILHGRRKGIRACRDVHRSCAMVKRPCFCFILLYMDIYFYAYIRFFRLVIRRKHDGSVRVMVSAQG